MTADEQLPALCCLLTLLPLPPLLTGPQYLRSRTPFFGVVVAQQGVEVRGAARCLMSP